jgi:hypothetical protein
LLVYVFLAMVLEMTDGNPNDYKRIRERTNIPLYIFPKEYSKLHRIYGR